MNRQDLKEAVSFTQSLLNLLLATLHGQTGLAGAQLQFLCGELVAFATPKLKAGAIGADIAACFDQARLAGGTFQAFDGIRTWAMGQTPKGLPAIALANATVRFSLIEQSYILAAMTFTSRRDIDNYLLIMNAAFDASEIAAADSLDNAAYQAMLALHAAVSGDLVYRSRPLPRVVNYQFGKRMPALVLAQRLYADPTRAEELIAENKVVHPLFCPPSGICLSA